MDYNKSLQKYVKKIIKLFMDLRFFPTSNTSFYAILCQLYIINIQQLYDESCLITIIPHINRIYSKQNTVMSTYYFYL